MLIFYTTLFQFTIFMIELLSIITGNLVERRLSFLTEKTKRFLRTGDAGKRFSTVSFFKKNLG